MIREPDHHMATDPFARRTGHLGCPALRPAMWAIVCLTVLGSQAFGSPAPAGRPDQQGSRPDAPRTSISVVLPPAGLLHDAWQALSADDIDRATALLDQAARAEPNNPLVYLARGLVAMRSGQSASAVESLTRALTLRPGLTPASIVLGEVFYERGELEAAIQAYKAAVARAPGDARLSARLERWQQEAALHATFFRSDGSHFTVLFEGPAEHARAQHAIDVLESAYDRISTTLLTFPADPITVVFYTRDQFRDITRSPQWSGGVFDGRIRIPLQGAEKDPRELERVLTHEFVHALVRSVAPRGVPTWLNEGLAGYFEPGGEARARAMAAGGGRRLRLAALAGSFAGLPEGDVPLAYAQSTLAVSAMIARADPLAVMALLADLAAGTEFSESFVQRFGIRVADFEREMLATSAPAR